MAPRVVAAPVGGFDDSQLLYARRSKKDESVTPQIASFIEKQKTLG
jgi:hypothetical protein